MKRSSRWASIGIRWRRFASAIGVEIVGDTTTPPVHLDHKLYTRNILTSLNRNGVNARRKDVTYHPEKFNLTTVIEDGNRTNIYAIEPPIEIMEVNETHNVKAERLNGRFAMMGVIAALGAYAVTGQIIPGVW